MLARWLPEFQTDMRVPAADATTSLRVTATPLQQTGPGDGGASKAALPAVAAPPAADSSTTPGSPAWRQQGASASGVGSISCRLSGLTSSLRANSDPSALLQLRRTSSTATAAAAARAGIAGFSVPGPVGGVGGKASTTSSGSMTIIRGFHVAVAAGTGAAAAAAAGVRCQQQHQAQQAQLQHVSTAPITSAAGARAVPAAAATAAEPAGKGPSGTTVARTAAEPPAAAAARPAAAAVPPAASAWSPPAAESPTAIVTFADSPTAADAFGVSQVVRLPVLPPAAMRNSVSRSFPSAELLPRICVVKLRGVGGGGGGHRSRLAASSSILA